MLAAETTPVLTLNDSAVHSAMVRWARAQIDAGRFPLDPWFPNFGLGFSQFHHYQSLPHILTAYASILGGPSTYQWSLYLLLATWPFSVYLGARWLGLDRWGAGVAAALSPLLVSATSYGFEHSSYTWQGFGIWAQLWGMWLLPLSFGLCWRAVNRGGSLAAAAVGLAATIACHFLAGYLALLALVACLVVDWRRLGPRLARAFFVGAAALALSAPVLLPAVLDSKYTFSTDYLKGTFWLDSYGAPKVLGWLVNGQLYDNGRLAVVTVLVAVGLLACLWGARRRPLDRALLLAWLMSMALFIGRPSLPWLIALLPFNNDLLLHRFIMGVHLAGLLVAGTGASALVAVVRAAGRAAWRRWRGAPAMRRTAPLRALGWSLAAAALVGYLAPAWQEVAAYDATGAGYIAQQQAAEAADGGAVASLAALARRMGGGRVYGGTSANWGTGQRVGSTPVYAALEDYDVDTVGFFYRVPSLSSDVEARFDERYPAAYDVLGIRYLLLPAERAPATPATRLAQRGDYVLWQVPSSGYLDAISIVAPPITADQASIGIQSSAFVYSSLPAVKAYPGVAFAGEPAPLPTTPTDATPGGPPGTVVVQSASPLDGVYRGSVNMAVEGAVVLKSSFDPGWQATVDGRVTPTELVAPSYPAVRVPPGLHSVEFRYRGYGGYALPLLALVAGIATLLAVANRRRLAGGRTPKP